MKQLYLAIDIGASSGRHILGSFSNGRLEIEEIYRFENQMVNKNGHLCWDEQLLLKEILNGMKRCKELGKVPNSIGIDTWAVDFVLLDGKDQIIGDMVAYRDNRTEGMDEIVGEVISEDLLYDKTGIQKQKFNTIYQLMSVKNKTPEQIEKAESLLLVPDYFHYKLTGKKYNEYTNATTTQLIHTSTLEWDYDLINTLGLPKKIFQPLIQPGTYLGELSQDIIDYVGYSCKVIVPATHDTGSAVVAVPACEKDFIYISSGTWSLMGVEKTEANTSTASRIHNFTNEGGYQKTIRYLKNIMGLWMIQSVKKEIGQGLTFDEICKQAKKESIESIVDCNDERFLAPNSMVDEIKKACTESGQIVPTTIYQLAAVIYRSLAKCYAKTVEEIQQLTGCIYDSVYIVGGGSNANYLNELTAKELEKTVYAGPTEATAIGNLVTQMISDGIWLNVMEARKCIAKSFPIISYKL